MKCLPPSVNLGTSSGEDLFNFCVLGLQFPSILKEYLTEVCSFVTCAMYSHCASSDPHDHGGFAWITQGYPLADPWCPDMYSILLATYTMYSDTCHALGFGYPMYILFDSPLCPVYSSQGIGKVGSIATTDIFLNVKQFTLLGQEISLWIALFLNVFRKVRSLQSLWAGEVGGGRGESNAPVLPMAMAMERVEDTAPLLVYVSAGDRDGLWICLGGERNVLGV